MVLFAIPVATFGIVDWWSEVDVDVAAHVYPNDPRGVQSDSNPATWKAMVTHWCYSPEGSPLLSALGVAQHCPVGITPSVGQLRAWDDGG